MDVFEFVNGTHRPRLAEHRVMGKLHLIQRKRPKLDLSELARLRWIERWSRKRLAQHFGKSELTIQNYFHRLKQGIYKIDKLPPDERRKIMLAWKRSG